MTTGTAKKGGIRIAIDWTDGDGDGDSYSDDAFRRSSPDRGFPPPSASRKRNGVGNGRARSSHDRGGTRIHIDVCFTSPPSSARKVKGGVFVDVRCSPDRGGGDVCFASPPSPAAARRKGRRNADAEADGEYYSAGMSNDALRRDIAGLSNGELRREIAGLGDNTVQSQPLLAERRRRLRPLLEAEARKRKEKAFPRSSADRGGEVCFASSFPPAPAKGTKARRHAAAEAEFFQGMSNEWLRRDIARLSDGELRREILGLRSSDTHPRSQPRLAERRRRLLPLLDAEARRRREASMPKPPAKVLSSVV